MGSWACKISPAQKPHGSLDAIFFAETPMPPQRGLRRLLQSPASVGSTGASIGSPTAASAPRAVRENRVDRVQGVHWCSEPLKEAGRLENLSPRSAPRINLILEGKSGPSAFEVGHSYVIAEVLTRPEPGSEASREELWRFNWGQGIKSGTNLTVVQDGVRIPPTQITGERKEAWFPGTCSGEKLLAFLQKWDGREYDVNPTNKRNCHHFVQDFLQTCTSHQTGYKD
mmetsp:Transcript_120202/g.256527  ORF Transcript_120202/g.256527 Transcript_120202/m.256527 type:complete len:227 (+) Transcript_120202:179-859(+)